MATPILPFLVIFVLIFTKFTTHNRCEANKISGLKKFKKFLKNGQKWRPKPKKNTISL
jgi:hypothetical protein